jgi:hypothetical protein
MFSQDLSKSKTLIFSVLCAFLLSPAFIVLHECGHVLAGKCVGWHSTLHFLDSRFDIPIGKSSRRNDILVTAAGPLVSAVLGTGGFLWLLSLRAQRRDAVLTPADLLAATLVMNVGRWMRIFASSPNHPKPDDEAWISRVMGLPGWLLPWLLATIAVVMIIAIIRLFPPRNRLMPFLALCLGGSAGSYLWMTVVGPWLLP